MIARARLNESERRQEQFREALELRAAQNLSAAEAAEAVTLDDLSEKWEPEVNVEDDEDIEWGEDVKQRPCSPGSWPIPIVRISQLHQLASTLKAAS